MFEDDEISIDLLTKTEILKTVKKYARLAEKGTEEYMKKVWEDLCLNYGLYMDIACDGYIEDEADIKKYWWEENGWNEEYDTFEDFLDDFSNDLIGNSNLRVTTYKLTPDASKPSDQDYDSYLRFFGQLFEELGLTDMAEEVSEMLEAYEE